MPLPGGLDAGCSAGLRAQVAQRLAGFEVRAHAPGPGAPRHGAAVALAIVEEGHGAGLRGIAAPVQWSGRAALLLTRRALHLRQHAGQWALPGGRIDAGESAQDAALRELREEVGLALPPGAVLGRLDDYATRSGFVITPIVVWAGAARDLLANPAEVASLHRIAFDEFLRADAPILEPSADPTHDHPALKMPVGESWIAAPTAAFLYQFREVCLLDRPTRVAHFDQPHFAWK